MSREQPNAGPPAISFPRVSWDEPEKGRAGWRIPAFSPRERG